MAPGCRRRRRSGWSPVWPEEAAWMKWFVLAVRLPIQFPLRGCLRRRFCFVLDLRRLRLIVLLALLVEVVLLLVLVARFVVGKVLASRLRILLCHPAAGYAPMLPKDRRPVARKRVLVLRRLVDQLAKTFLNPNPV